MRFPHRRYIQYQILIGMEDDEIRCLCVKDNLVPPDSPGLARLRFDLADRPSPEQILDPDQGDVRAWLGNNRLDGMVLGNDYIREVLDILRTPTLRYPVEVLILSDYSAQMIREFCKKQGLKEPTEKAILAFRNYFWDAESLSFGELVEFLHLHPLGEMYLSVLADKDGRTLAVAKALANRAGKSNEYHYQPESRYGPQLPPVTVPEPPPPQ